MAEASISQKENAPPSLRQTTLLGALDKGITKGRKRTITLVNGDEVDLTAAIPVTSEVLDAMRLRIIQLEDEMASPAPPKRAKKAAPTASAVASTSASASVSAPTASSSKAEDKKRKMQVKKIFDRLKKECKAEGVKFQGSPKTIKLDEVLEPAEFEALFGGKGRLIQPTPQNKPKSAVTIIEFTTAAHIAAFFGDELKPLKGTVWSRGGVPTGGFGGFFGGGGGGFSKSIKQGACDVEIHSVEISYSKNNLKCTLKFEVGQAGRGGGGGYDSDCAFPSVHSTQELIVEQVNAPAGRGRPHRAHRPAGRYAHTMKIIPVNRILPILVLAIHIDLVLLAIHAASHTSFKDSNIPSLVKFPGC